MSWRDWTFPDKENEIDERIARYHAEQSSHASDSSDAKPADACVSAPREDLQKLWRQMNYIEPFEQPSPLCKETAENFISGDPYVKESLETYTNASQKVYDGDISTLMGCLA